MEDELLTVDEVARTLKVTRKAVYDLMRAGRLPYVQIGIRRGRRVRRSVLDLFLEQGIRGIDPESYTSEDQQAPLRAAGFAT